MGVGLDNVPFEAARERGIAVTYTPDAPTQAVAELVVGLMLDGMRHISATDRHMHAGTWDKYMGSLLHRKTVGIIGVGRIGKQVIRLLEPYGIKVLGNDVRPDEEFGRAHNVQWVEKEELFAHADIVSLNLSYSADVEHLINSRTIGLMQPHTFLINTARGPLVKEEDLYQALKRDQLAGAAIDVYEHEPYNGPLAECDNVILTSHMGAATTESRRNMEVGAVEEVVRFHTGAQLLYQIDHAA